MLDGIYLRQIWVGNEAMLIDLARDESPAGRDRLHFFLINKGTWSRLDHNEPFVPGAPPKPAGGNFYPVGATKAEIEKWIQSLPEAERARATGFFTVIRRADERSVHGRSRTASSIRTSWRTRPHCCVRPPTCRPSRR